MSESSVKTDVLITGDFRYPGGTSSAIAEEIKVLRGSGIAWKLDQFDSKVFRNRPLNPKILNLAAESDFLGDGVIECRIWFVHNPHCLLWGIPQTKVKAESIVIVAHQAPLSFSGSFYYDPWKIDREFRACHPGSHVTWASISPLCREMFSRTGFEGEILDFDWFNIFSGDFSSPSPLDPSGPARIGCHGRPQSEKWPGDRKTALLVYPDDERHVVTLLGPDGASSGPIHPFSDRWTVHPFNGISMEAYFDLFDFFVYSPRPDYVETFGRTVAEAVLNGKLAILPPSLEPTFGDLADYAEPAEVKALISRYMDNPDAYLSAVTDRRDRALSVWGHGGYLKRLTTLLEDGTVTHSSPCVPRVGTNMTLNRLRLARQAFVSGLKPMAKRLFGESTVRRLKGMLKD